MRRIVAVGVLSAAVLAALMRASVAHAAWDANGDSIAAFPCEELPTAAVSDGRAGMYVVWTDNRVCSYDVVYVQRITGSGSIAAAWPDGGIPVAALTGGEQNAEAATDDSGGVIVVWEDGRLGGQRLYAQRIAPDATPLWASGGVPVCDAAGDQVFPSILSDGHGGVFATWMDTRRGLNDGPPYYHPFYDLYAQHIDSSGERAWTSTADSVATNADVAAAPTLVTDGSSGVLVTWLDSRGPAYFQHLDVSGTAHLQYDGVAIPGLFLGINDANVGLVASDGTGGMISTFMHGPDTQQDLFAQRVDSTGALVWPLNGVLVATAPFDQRPNSIMSDGTHGAYIAWHDLRNGVDWDIYLQRINPDGAAAPGWPPNGLAVCTAPGFQTYPQLIPSGEGCVLAWQDDRSSTTGYDIYAQRITPDGLVPSGWPANGVALCTATGNQLGPIPVSDGSGGALMAWSDYRVYADVYAQRVSGMGTVGDSVVALAVGPPGRPRELLAHVYPNPSSGEVLSLSLSLPDASPAELSVFDLRGRRLAHETIAAGQSGQIDTRLRLPGKLSPGIYLVRLSQAKHTFSTKVSVLR